MFRVDFDERPTGVTMRIEGRFAGHFADEARQLMVLRDAPAPLIVDVTEITFADAEGEKALKWLGDLGAAFVAESAYALDLCERLYLRLQSSELARMHSRN